MLDRIIIGRYVPGNSIIYRLDARAKIAFVFAFVFLVFLANNTPTYIFLLVLSLAIVKMTAISFSYIRQGLQPLIWIMLFTFILHIFFTKQGTLIFDFWFLKIYSGGLIQGIYICIRFFVLLLITTLLTLTTTPIEITDGLESLLAPLKKLKFPVHELALMISIALRFIPTLLQETSKIMKAQSARGAKFSLGSMKERIQAIVALLVPLFINAFKRAEDLAVAMEARGYRGGVGRTKIREYHWKLNDTLTIVSIFVIIIVLVVLRKG